MAVGNGLHERRGSGKTTLLKCLGAVIESTRGRMPPGGEVIYDDEPTATDARSRKRARDGGKGLAVIRINIARRQGRRMRRQVHGQIGPKINEDPDVRHLR